MKTLLALVLSLSSVGHADSPKEIEATLRELRTNVRYVDVSAEGRLVTRAKGLMARGTTGIMVMIDSDVPYIGLVSLPVGLAMAAGGAIGVVLFAVGKVARVIAPWPNLEMTADEYRSAPGLNQFLRLKHRRQYAIAAGDVELLGYFKRINAAFATARQYELLPAANADDSAVRP